ncbi:hypothetical protein V8E53_009400 [Lactarius tabidus]
MNQDAHEFLNEPHINNAEYDKNHMLRERTPLAKKGTNYNLLMEAAKLGSGRAPVRALGFGPPPPRERGKEQGRACERGTTQDDAGTSPPSCRAQPRPRAHRGAYSGVCPPSLPLPTPPPPLTRKRHANAGRRGAMRGQAPPPPFAPASSTRRQGAVKGLPPSHPHSRARESAQGHPARVPGYRQLPPPPPPPPPRPLWVSKGGWISFTHEGSGGGSDGEGRSAVPRPFAYLGTREGGGGAADGEGSTIPPPLCLPQRGRERRRPGGGGGGGDGTCEREAALDTCAPPSFPPPLPAFCVYPRLSLNGGRAGWGSIPPFIPCPFCAKGHEAACERGC